MTHHLTRVQFACERQNDKDEWLGDPSDFFFSLALALHASLHPLLFFFLLFTSRLPSTHPHAASNADCCFISRDLNGLWCTFRYSNYLAAWCNCANAMCVCVCFYLCMFVSLQGKTTRRTRERERDDFKSCSGVKGIEKARDTHTNTRHKVTFHELHWNAQKKCQLKVK